MADARKKARGGSDPIEMLKADHKAVKALFKQFAALKDDAEDNEDEKAAVVAKICKALTVHTALEEEIFYPAVRAAIDESDLMDEALVEHAGAKDLITQLEGMSSGDDLYDAKVKVLAEQINHHVQEEEGEMFPKAKRADLDLEHLGATMEARKQELQSELGTDFDDQFHSRAAVTKGRASVQRR